MSVAISLNSARLGPRGEWSRWERSQIERLRNGISCDDHNLEWFEGVSDDEAPWIAAVYEDTDDLYLHITRVDDHYALLASDLSVDVVSDQLSVLVDQSLKSPTPLVFKDNVRRVSFRLDPVAMAAAVALAVGQWYEAQKQAIAGTTETDAPLDQDAQGVAITFAETGLAANKVSTRRSTSFTTEKRQIDSLFAQDAGAGGAARAQPFATQSSSNTIRMIDAFGLVIATALGTVAAAAATATVTESHVTPNDASDNVLLTALINEDNHVKDTETPSKETLTVSSSPKSEDASPVEVSEIPQAKTSQVEFVQQDAPAVGKAIEPVNDLRQGRHEDAEQRHQEVALEPEALVTEPPADPPNHDHRPLKPWHVNPQDFAELRELAEADRFDFIEGMGARPPLPEWLQSESAPGAWENGDCPMPPILENIREDAPFPPEVAEAFLPMVQFPEYPMPQEPQPYLEDTFLF